MKFIYFTIFGLFYLFPFLINAESWDFVKSSGQYYYGEGMGKTADEADKAAMADLISQISTHVSADFKQIDDVTNKNGEVDHNTRVLNCVKTYSQSSLTNVEKWVDGKEPNITVRRYMKKSELARIFENRIDKAKNMLAIADQCLENNKIDMALQYYYWAYSLIRSVQFPNEVKSADGKIIVDWIPLKINDILSDIRVEYLGKEGDFTDLMFTYKNNPVSSLEFSYSDGRALCQGLAKDGRGMIEMIPGYETDIYHLDIEYEYKNQARGDAEMESVLNVISPRNFPKASFKVTTNSAAPSMAANIKVTNERESGAQTKDIVTKDSEKVNSVEDKNLFSIINNISDAIATKRFADVSSYFTIDGLQMFNRLTNYGKARVVDASDLKQYKGIGNNTIVRGLKMSFSFDGRSRKTFVEDVSFTFNKDNKIENVAFGLGKSAEDGIFNKNAVWSDEVREIIVSFMENYKTAYSLERLDYIKSIFDDNATIIVGNVVKPSARHSTNLDGHQISLEGQDVIKYNRYTKDAYIKQLERCFNRNDFINLKFSNHEIQWLEKFEDQKIFAINIRQQYSSSTYSDDGYLFLLVDMSNHEEPLIKVRTWQPNEVALDKLYNAGDFFND